VCVCTRADVIKSCLVVGRSRSDEHKSRWRASWIEVYPECGLALGVCSDIVLVCWQKVVYDGGGLLTRVVRACIQGRIYARAKGARAHGGKFPGAAY
jgi:hypothetical protein